MRSDHAEHIFADGTRLVLSPYSVRLLELNCSLRNPRSASNINGAALFKASTEPDPRAEPPFGSTTSHHGSIAGKPTGASRGRGRRHPATSVSACGGSSSSDNVEKASSAIAQLRSSGINDGQHSAGHLFEHCHVRQRQGGGMKMQGTVDGVHIPL